MAFTVKKVYKNSAADRAGLKTGDIIEKINGEDFIDQIDYAYFVAEEALELTLAGGKTLLIQKAFDEDLGADFAESLLGEQQRCKNKCVFCFVDQLPKGMRDTLSFKDDDWRLSFMMGNYITLTNVSEADFERILRRRVSPLYISVHATQADVRKKLLGNPNSDIYGRLKRLKSAGIRFNAQVVLVPGVNDGEVLERTVRDLRALFPACGSVAIVPVGLTAHREGLAEISAVSKELAQEELKAIKQLQAEFLSEIGTRFVFASDELFIRAGEALPRFDEYEDFAQIENGVGLVAEFEDEAAWAMDEFSGRAAYREVSAVTGVDFAPYLKAVAKEAEKRYHIKINIYPIENRFFGSSITVTGLLTAGDILEQLEGREIGEALIVPAAALKEFDDVFLDDITLEEFQARMGVACIKSGGGYDFIRILNEKI